MIKINLTNEIYSKQTKYWKPQGKDETIIEYFSQWFSLHGKPKFTGSGSSTEDGFKWFRKFIGNHNSGDWRLRYICTRTITQILKPKGN